jgi:hypothetical protein
MFREAQCRTWDWNEEIHANVDDLNGGVSCDAATLARAVSSHR